MNLPVATLPQNRRITPEKALHLFRASVASLPANAVYIFKFKILHIPPVFSPVVTYKSFFANHVGLKIATWVSNTVANARTGVRAGPPAEQEAMRWQRTTAGSRDTRRSHQQLSRNRPAPLFRTLPISRHRKDCENEGRHSLAAGIAAVVSRPVFPVGRAVRPLRSAILLR